MTPGGTQNSETAAEKRAREAREAEEAAAAQKAAEKAAAEEAAADKAAAEKAAAEKRHPVDYLVSHARALLGVRPLVMRGALGMTDRKTLTIDEAKKLLKDAAEQTVHPLAGTPQEPPPKKDEDDE